MNLFVTCSPVLFPTKTTITDDVQPQHEARTKQGVLRLHQGVHVGAQLGPMMWMQ